MVFEGSFKEILEHPNLSPVNISAVLGNSLPPRRPVAPASVTADKRRLVHELHSFHEALEPMHRDDWREPVLRLTNASKHNLKDVSLEVPLGRFVCVTGVSGSGKTTLVREVLLPALLERVGTSDRASRNTPEATDPAKKSDTEEELPEAARTVAAVSGMEHLGGVVLVDRTDSRKRLDPTLPFIRVHLIISLSSRRPRPPVNGVSTPARSVSTPPRGNANGVAARALKRSKCSS